MFENPAARIVIPTIVLAELKYLHRRSRIPLALSVVERLIVADERCLIFPMTEEVVRLLPVELDIHDAIICATALAYNRATGLETAVLTRDEAIVGSGLVPVLW